MAAHSDTHRSTSMDGIVALASRLFLGHIVLFTESYLSPGSREPTFDFRLSIIP